MEDFWLGTLPEASSLFQVAHAARASERSMLLVLLMSTCSSSSSWLGLGSGLGLGLGLGLANQVDRWVHHTVRGTYGMLRACVPGCSFICLSLSVSV